MFSVKSSSKTHLKLQYNANSYIDCSKITNLPRRCYAHKAFSQLQPTVMHHNRFKDNVFKFSNPILLQTYDLAFKRIKHTGIDTEKNNFIKSFESSSSSSKLELSQDKLHYKPDVNIALDKIRGRINSKNPKAYRYLTTLVLDSGSDSLIEAEKKIPAENKHASKISRTVFPSEFINDLALDPIKGVFSSIDNNPYLASTAESGSDLGSGSDPRDNPNPNDNDDNIPSGLLTGFSSVTENDTITNVVAGFSKSKHILLYQEDEWGESNAIQLLLKAANVTNSKVIAIDIPDWSVIGTDLGEHFEELTVISHPYTPPPSLSEDGLSTSNRHPIYSLFKRIERKDQEENDNENENENEENEDEVENEDESSSAAENPKNRNKEEKQWFELDDSDKRSKPVSSGKRSTVLPSPTLPADFLENPLSQSETEILDRRLMEFIESKTLFADNSAHESSLIIAVKHLGDLLNTRIGYTLFSRLVTCTQNFNQQIKLKYSKTGTKSDSIQDGYELIRGPTMIAGLMHPSIFNPDIAPPTLPPFDTNPSAPSAIKNQSMTHLKPKVGGGSSIDASLSSLRKSSSDNDSSHTRPLIVAISSLGSKAQPIVPKFLRPSLTESIRSNLGADSLLGSSFADSMPIGSSLFTRIALPLVGANFSSLKAEIPRKWGDKPVTHDKKLSTLLSMRQKVVLSQIYMRNASILRNILILSQVSDIKIVDKTLSNASKNSGNIELSHLNSYISIQKTLALLQQIPGDLAGRFFLTETFLHRLVTSSVGVVIMEKLNLVSKNTNEYSNTLDLAFDDKEGNKIEKPPAPSSNDVFSQKIVIEPKHFIQAWLQVATSYKVLGKSAYFNPVNRAFSLGAEVKYPEFKISKIKNNPEFGTSKFLSSLNDAELFVSTALPYEVKPFILAPVDSIGVFVKDRLSVGINIKSSADAKDFSSIRDQDLENDHGLGDDVDDTGSGGVASSSDKALPSERTDDLENADHSSDNVTGNSGSASSSDDTTSSASLAGQPTGVKNNSSSSQALNPKARDTTDDKEDTLSNNSTEEVDDIELDTEVIRRVRALKDARLNSYEKRLLTSIVNPKSIPSGFSNVCAKSETIITLQELISLPLLCPELFGNGVLGKHSISGLLLFGPPGTGKTMLAKAVAKESGSLVLNIKSSDVYDKYVGEGEKLVKAIFSLARRISPCVVFIDEVDAIFGARNNDRSSGYKREIITQFMAEWDGLTSTKVGKNKPRVMVMAATNRPFDLDDAILRRLPRRILVDLPDEAERSKIIRLHLDGESIGDDVDIDAIAKKAKLYSGSDLKNLCIAAALSAVREKISTHLSLLEKDGINGDKQFDISSSDSIAIESSANDTEKIAKTGIEPATDKKEQVNLDSNMLMRYIKDLRKKKAALQRSKSSTDAKNYTSSEVSDFKLPVCNRHFESAFKMVSSSCSDDMSSVSELHKWNEKYGDNAKTRKNKITLGFENLVSEKKQ